MDKFSLSDPIPHPQHTSLRKELQQKNKGTLSDAQLKIVGQKIAANQQNQPSNQIPKALPNAPSKDPSTKTPNQIKALIAQHNTQEVDSRINRLFLAAAALANPALANPNLAENLRSQKEGAITKLFTGSMRRGEKIIDTEMFEAKLLSLLDDNLKEAPAEANAVKALYKKLSEPIGQANAALKFFQNLHKEFGETALTVWNQIPQNRRVSLLEGQEELTEEMHASIIKRCNKLSLKKIKDEVPEKVFDITWNQISKTHQALFNSGEKTLSKPMQEIFIKACNEEILNGFREKFSPHIVKQVLEEVADVETLGEINGGQRLLNSAFQTGFEKVCNAVHTKMIVSVKNMKFIRSLQKCFGEEVFKKAWNGRVPARIRDGISEGTTAATGKIAQKILQKCTEACIYSPKPLTKERVKALQKASKSLEQSGLTIPSDLRTLIKTLSQAFTALELSTSASLSKTQKDRVAPARTTGGISGSYFLKGVKSQSEALKLTSNAPSLLIFKPELEEIYGPENPHTCYSFPLPKLDGERRTITQNLRAPLGSRSFRLGNPSGEASKKEHVAYLLDHDHFSGVPLTLSVEVPNNPLFVQGTATKTGSVQVFQPGCKELGQLTVDQQKMVNPQNLKRIGILDIRLGNNDRHQGNILAREIDSGADKIYDLIPIDHGLTLPDSLNEMHLDWTVLPASRISFDEEELAYIAKLDPDKDTAILRAQGIREPCILPMVARTIVLQEGAKVGLNLFDIASIFQEKGKVCKFANMYKKAEEAVEAKGTSFKEEFTRNAAELVNILAQW